MTLSDHPLFAVIGNPVKHSRSPAIHKQFALQTGIPLDYVLLEAPVDRFVATTQAFFAQGGRGLNVTVPFKQEAWQLAQANLSTRARQARAVNTLWMRDDALHGCNTDGIGLVSDLVRQGIKLEGARLLMIGAGGAARGVVGPLLEAGCARLHIVNRTARRAHDLLEGWTRQDGSPEPRLTAGGLSEAPTPGGWDVVINASASSLGDRAPEVPAGLYAPNAWAYDMMYAAKPTAFMLQALEDGAQQVSDGLGMLVGQAAESFWIWHGVRPDVAPVLAAIRQELTAPLFH